MTMDLWYDLAARELPDSDEELMERLHITDGVAAADEQEDPTPRCVMAMAG